EYALAGFVVLPFLFGPRWLLLAAALVLIGIYLVMPLFPPLLSLPGPAWMANHVAEATRAYGSGGLLDVMEFRIREIPSICLLHAFVLPRTVALFLFGALVWRTGLFTAGTRGNTALLLGLAVLATCAGVGLAAATQGRIFISPFPGGAGESA